MTTVGPVDHIARRPFPWRTGADLTECGKPVSELPGRVVDRDAIRRRIRDVGQRRAAYTTCMTCVTTSDRWAGDDTEVSGVIALGREISAVAHATAPAAPHVVRGTVHTPSGSFDESHWVAPTKRDQSLWERQRRLIVELRAIAALVEAHRDEFEGYLTGLESTVSLMDRRRSKRSQGGK